MLYYEKEAYISNYKLIGGIDEAGRGPLAGPVAAACVIFPKDYYREGINDSKKLSPKKREKLFDVIKNDAVAWKICFADVDYIEKYNILNATKYAASRAVKEIAPKPDYILTDALELNDITIGFKSIIKGDSLSISIAAASILAKVERDRLMTEYDSIYPEYNFAKHKGYGTKEHIEAIKKYGPCKIHRMSFLKNILK